ncbi:MAG: hypothetical protein PHW63_03175 [Alphaproteobacteria bacterium]|nr:hypothetical protein [Alphaproteobacteria bacterium]
MSTNHDMIFTFLAQGVDTLEVCYYLDTRNPAFSFEKLAAVRDGMDRQKYKDGKKITLGGKDFLLKAGGTSSGFPFMMRDNDFIIQFGEFNNPSFSVKFLSNALWHKGYRAMHEDFLVWAAGVGLYMRKTETISRVDLCLDYELINKAFGEENFVSSFHRDCKFRSFGEDETYKFGVGTCVRIYNKSNEIKAKSGKTWFYPIWGGLTDNVWRIEWQLNNDYLKQRGIRTLADFEKSIGFVIGLLCEYHTSLRTITSDTNRARWPMHPLWLDVRERFSTLGMQPIKAASKLRDHYPERVQSIVISMMGNIKAIAALTSVYDDTPPQGFQETLTNINGQLRRIYDPLSWQQDVQKKMDKLRLADV